MRVGIDLGTTNSVVAYMKSGKPETVANLQGEYWTPSVVQAVSGRVLVGKEAKENLPFLPEHTVYSIKRFMGRSAGDEELERARKFVPYRVDDPTGGKTDLVVHLGDTAHTPIEISAMILKKLIEDTEKTLGVRPQEAVVTVPAYFSERQKDATRQAARQAGLSVLRILDEPTAAALAFGMETQSDDLTILVFDLGGGTLDVSVLLLTAGMFTTLKITGDNFLGGDDFDNVILARLLQEVNTQSGADYTDDPKVRAHLKKVAESTKMALSASNEHRVDAFIPPDANRPMIALSTKLDRFWFEEATKPLVDRAIKQVNRALDEAELETADIDHVLLVGGSSRIPQVQQGLAKIFGEDKLNRQLNPMLCVGLGAAILAESISSGSADEDLVRVTPKSLGIEVEDGRFDPLIPSGTTYPFDEAVVGFYKTVEPNQREIIVDVFEGEASRCEENEWVGDVIADIDGGVPQGTPVDVSFTLDDDGIIRVSVAVSGFPSAVKEAHVERGERRRQPNRGGPAADDIQTQLEKMNRFVGAMQQGCTPLFGRFPQDKQMIDAAVQRMERALELGDPTEMAAAKEEGNTVIQTVSGDTYVYFVAWNAVVNRAKPERARNCDRLTQEAAQALRSGDMRAYDMAMGQLESIVVEIHAEGAKSGAPAPATRSGGLRRR